MSLEESIQQAKATAPRVTPAEIAALMERVHYQVELRPAGSTSTFVHAFLDGRFYLGTGHSACVSPENYRQEIGTDIASRHARRIAEDKLWELEGYRLYAPTREVESKEQPLRDLLNSAYNIAERNGLGTAWSRFRESLQLVGATPHTARVYRVDSQDPEYTG